MKKGRLYLLFCACLLVSLLPAQNKVIDSLESLTRTAPNDTIKAKAWVLMGEVIYETSPEKSVEYWENAIALSQKEHKGAKEKKALAILQGDALNNIAIVYFFEGNTRASLEKNFESLKIREKIKDIHGMAESMNNIANVYLDQGDTTSGLDFLKKSGIYYAQIDDQGGVAYNYINSAKIYLGRHNDSVALDYLFKAKEILEKNAHLKIGLASALNRIGNIYKRHGNTKLAKSYLVRAMNIRLEVNDLTGLSSSYTSMAAFYDEAGRPDSAQYYAQKALNQRQAPLDALAEAALVSSRIYRKAGNFEKAFEQYEFYIRMRDSISNDNTRKLMLRNQYKYAYENKVAKDSVLHAEEARINTARLEKEKAVRYGLFAGLTLIIVFSVFLYGRFRVIKRQKSIIEQQKSMVEMQRDLVAEKQKEIIDSINYAKRIQHAILAREEEIRKIFPESFLLYKPKDIVAGDFYFFETTDTHVFYAAADCTGHGVPGALVSVVCSNALTRCIKEFNITDPGKILDKTRELVLETFQKSGQEVKDGMDISLISMKLQEGLRFNAQGLMAGEGREQEHENTTTQIQNTHTALNIKPSTINIEWSGANNPLWIIEKKAGEGSLALREIRPDKQPIGHSENPRPFTTHRTEVPAGSGIFLFTDGYADQFGGEKGKKFKTANFEKLLVQISNFTMQRQGQELDNTFQQWKGDYEQLDDICVIGIKI